jgi:eukaryotic-like serine/threonine-protein kinase
MSVEEKASSPSAKSRRPCRRKIGKYSIIREVGRGSSGTVYLSHDPFYGRDVAIKLYKEPSGEDEAELRVARKMFFNEAQMVGRLQHPNILPIFDAGEETGATTSSWSTCTARARWRPTAGPTTCCRSTKSSDRLQRGARDALRAHARRRPPRHQAQQHHAHHDNEVRVIDFGIALGRRRCLRDPRRGRLAELHVARAGQGRGDHPRSDIYALGAVMYELLTGRRPFKAANLAKLLHQIVFATPHPIHKLRPEVPEELEEVVWRAMRKKPEDRFNNGLEFAAALTRVHQSLRSTRDALDERERVAILRGLRFFHDFSHTEIRELIKAAEWREYASARTSCARARLDDRFYVIVTGEVAVEVDGKPARPAEFRAIASARAAWCRMPAARPRSGRSGP